VKNGIHEVENVTRSQLRNGPVAKAGSIKPVPDSHNQETLHKNTYFSSSKCTKAHVQPGLCPRPYSTPQTT